MNKKKLTNNKFLFLIILCMFIFLINGCSNKNETKEVSVYIRVEGYDKTLIPRTKINVGVYDLTPYLGVASGSSSSESKGWGVDRFEKPTAAHAIVKVLNDNGYKSREDYDLQDYGWSLYMAMIGGDREFDYRGTSGWMYRVNDVLPDVGCNEKEIKDGDEIVWYFGAYGFDTLLTKLNLDKTKIKTGEDITLTLNGVKNDEETWEIYDEPVNGAVIYVNGEKYVLDEKDVITDEIGQAVITFNEPGEYIISAERFDKRKNIRNIARPNPIIVNIEK